MVIGNQHPNRVVLVGFEIEVRGGGSQGAVGIERTNGSHSPLLGC